MQGIPGLINNDACTFDFFTHTVKPARNVKKDLQAFLKKRSKYTISNLKLPELDGKEKYRPIKNMEPVENSESLNYNSAQAIADTRAAARNKGDTDLDNVLKNIRDIMLTSSIKLKTITPDLID